MPAPSIRRQPDSRSLEWFRGATGRRLVSDAQRQAIPELTRIFGHSGLFLRPFGEHPAELSGNMLARVLSLHRDGRGLDGDLRCRDDELPLASDSLSLVYALFPFESASEPAALMREIARVLKPDGIALLFSLNPWSPSRLRWLFHVGAPVSGLAMAAMAREAGLDVVRSRHLGEAWTSARAATSLDPDRGRLFEGFRATSLVVARRHDIPLTLQRKPLPAVGLSPGMSTG
jgi:SAM-dependent methyltransferase